MTQRWRKKKSHPQEQKSWLTKQQLALRMSSDSVACSSGISYQDVAFIDKTVCSQSSTSPSLPEGRPWMQLQHFLSASWGTDSAATVLPMLAEEIDQIAFLLLLFFAILQQQQKHLKLFTSFKIKGAHIPANHSNTSLFCHLVKCWPKMNLHLEVCLYNHYNHIVALP